MLKSIKAGDDFYSANTLLFSNGLVVAGFKDHLYCQWQSSARVEDGDDTWVSCNRSKDEIN